MLLHRHFDSGFPSAALSRRELIRIGGLGLMGLSLPRVLRAEASIATNGVSPRADACIVIFLNGGPSHLDMWDMKPEAPVEIRGAFQPIHTSLPGVALCEHLPRLARQLHQTTLIRSMHHSVNSSHAAAVYTGLTGHDRGELGGPTKITDHPPPGSVLTRLLPPKKSAVPYVVLPYKTKEGSGPLQPGFLGGFLGQSTDPFWVLENPNATDFRVPNISLATGMSPGRLAARRDLLAGLNSHFESKRSEPGLGAVDKFQHRAVKLLTSDGAQRAFRVDLEPGPVRDAYGRNIYGQSVLLARRLIEAGTRFVTVTWAPNANATWDTHSSNFKKLKNTLLPQFDAACSRLLEDLSDRGMLERTVVAVMGDFGRTPKINNLDGGRDHWNNCYTIMLAGGGIKPGFVYGASDRTGAVPVSNPVIPADIIATIYHLFGIDHRDDIYDHVQRPYQIVRDGSVVHDLLV